jgi:hypothetical protein
MNPQEGEPDDPRMGLTPRTPGTAAPTEGEADDPRMGLTPHTRTRTRDRRKENPMTHGWG